MNHLDEDKKGFDFKASYVIEICRKRQL